GAPLAGIPTTRAIAASVTCVDRPVIAVMPAGRGRVVWSKCADGALEPPRNTTVEELRAVAHAEQAVVASESALSGIGDVVVIPAGARVEQIARLGWERILQGERDDPAMLEPIYAHGRRS